jgi:branched-chain amino acid transport system ATP-binding protein
MILEAEHLAAAYGASQILFDIHFQLEAGETVCLLGRNGVGKTTTLRTVMGMLKPKSGRIRFEESDIGGVPPHKVSRMGIAYVPQGRHIFANLTTRENLIISARKGIDPEQDWTIPKVYELFPKLRERADFKGGRLSGGEQQMLCIARGLMQNPKLLLMDEIFEGLAPIVIREIALVVQRLKTSGVSMLVAEQSVEFAREMAGRCYILEKGQVVYSGDSGEIPQSVIFQYLGT